MYGEKRNKKNSLLENSLLRESWDISVSQWHLSTEIKWRRVEHVLDIWSAQNVPEIEMDASLMRSPVDILKSLIRPDEDV